MSHALAGLAAIGGILPSVVFFEPKEAFVSWMNASFATDPIIEVGAGTGRTARKLTEAGLKVGAVDIHMRQESEFPVAIFDATIFPFSDNQVVLICRPCHGCFAEAVIEQAISRKVKAIVYVGKPANVSADLAGYRSRFKKEMAGAGRDNESVYVWRSQR